MAGRITFKEEYRARKKIAKDVKHHSSRDLTLKMKYWNYVKNFMAQRKYVWLSDIIGETIECHGSTGLGHYWGVIKEVDLINGDFVLTNDKTNPGEKHGKHWRKGEKETDRGDYPEAGQKKAIRLCWFDDGESRADAMMRKLQMAVADKKAGDITEDEFNKRNSWILFDQIDADGSGDITTKELEDAVRRKTIT